MIPKKIHYCWFGRGEKPKLERRCIESWRNYCPDYEVIAWNEDNFDFDVTTYTKYCYEKKKWAFLSDYVRLWVVEKYGGIYFDTDVEVIKSFDELLSYEAFYGFENEEYVASGLGFGAISHHPTIKAMLDEYEQLSKDSENMQMVGCPILNTKAVIPFGLELTGETQVIAGAHILSKDYLNPYEDATGKLYKTDNTFSIHWYAKSALDTKTKIRSRLTKPFHRLFGVRCFESIKQIMGKLIGGI